MKPITVGITTRGRLAALGRCLRSLALVDAVVDSVVVYDDPREQPAGPAVAEATPAGMRISVITDHAGKGYICGRNLLVKSASTPYVLLLDDDTIVFAAAAIERAIALLDADPDVAAIAFAQAEADGSPWPEQMQAGRGDRPARVASFIGFAHMIRRDVFLRLGGYRESFVFYGEEKDYCLRLLDAGLRTVYLPDGLIGHVADRGGRSNTRYARHAVKNDCLFSLYNEPLPLILVSLPVRLWRYRRMASDAEAGGFRWILRELWQTLPDVRRARRAVSWSTIFEWRKLVRQIVPYRAQESGQ